jgi:hypothetical protein
MRESVSRDGLECRRFDISTPETVHGFITADEEVVDTPIAGRRRDHGVRRGSARALEIAYHIRLAC